VDCLRIKVPGSARHCPALPGTARVCPGVTGIDRSARECPIYSIGRALEGTTAGHLSPTPPPPAPPCGGGAGWRRCDLRECLSKSEPLRGWSARSRGRIGSGRAEGRRVHPPLPKPARAFLAQTARALGPSRRPPAAGRTDCATALAAAPKIGCQWSVVAAPSPATASESTTSAHSTLSLAGDNLDTPAPSGLPAARLLAGDKTKSGGFVT